MRWAAAIVLLLCGWGAAKADCIVENDHTLAAAYAQCEAAEKSFLIPPRTWTNNQCAPVPDAPSSISCSYYGDGVIGVHSCSGCFTWDSPPPPVEPAKNCCTPAPNGSNPIMTGLGYKTETQTDLAATAQGLLGFTRYYTSWDYSHGGWAGILTSDLGAQWRHTYTRSLLVDNESTLDHVVALRANGQALLFVYSNGAWTPDADVALRLSDTLVSGTRTGWDLTDTDDTVEHYDVYGTLQSITLRGGFVESLSYDANGLLQRVSDGFGRTLAFSHDATKRLTAVTAADGTQVLFGYGAGYLTSVTYPGGGVRTYRYGEGAYGQPWQLSGIVDENGSRYASWQYDALGRAWLSVHGEATGTVDRVELSYDGDITTSTAATVTGKQWIASDGSTALQRLYRFSVLFGVVKLKSVDQPCDRCADGRVQARSYDAAGYPATSTDFNNVTTATQYDARGLEGQRVEAAGTAQQRTTATIWNPGFHLPDERSVRNVGGDIESLTRWKYNTRGQVTARCQIDPLTATGTTNTAALAYVCGSPANAPDGVRQWKYTYCDAVGGACPVVGLLLSVDGPRTDLNDVTTYAYYTASDPNHNAGDLQSVTNALGHVITYVSYDKTGRVTRLKDANGTVTDLTYHPRGWLLTRTVRANADGTANATADATTTFAYDAVGNVTQVTQPDKTYLHYVYDAAHRLTDVYDSATPANYLLGNHIHYTLDAAGNRVDEQTSDASGASKRELSRAYDRLNRLTALLNSSGVAVQTFVNAPEVAAGAPLLDGYDGNGNALFSIDGSAYGAGTEQQYDPLNRLVKTLQDHLSTRSTSDTATAYAYDTSNHVRSVIDPDGLVTRYTYDRLDNLTDLSSPDTGHTAYGYDSAGNRQAQIDARGVTTSYRYDALGRLTAIVYPTASLNVTYAYDQPAAGCFNIGRLTQFTDSTGYTQYCYDRRGNVTKKTQSTLEPRSCATTETGCTSGFTTTGLTLATPNPTLTGTALLTLTYTYTLGDRVASIGYPSGATVVYARDVVGRVVGITYQPQKTGAATPTFPVLNNVTWYPFGPSNVISFGNGRSLSKTYDADYAIGSVLSSANDGLTIVAHVDRLGNLTAASATAIGGVTQQYLYDPLFRLNTVEDGAGKILLDLTYGPSGDRLSKTFATNVQTYTYDAFTHRATSVGGVARAFDANGNLLNGGLSYDDRNRLSGWNLYGGQISLTSKSALYGYNGRGERTSKQVTQYAICAPPTCSTQPGTPSGWLTGTEAFVYDESGLLLGEYPSLYAAGIATDYIYLDGVPVALARNGVVYYIETDQLGTPRQIVKPGITTAGDATVWKWDYFAANSAFGENPPSLQTLTFNLRFPGQYFDAETGLNYNYFRDYEAATGRYVESDPIGLHAGVSTYAYVAANPLRNRDVLGLAGCGSGWNERLVPDNPFRFKFGPCCDSHDECYDCAGIEARFDKKTCDKKLRSCMFRKCQHYSAPIRFACHRTAALYYQVVDKFGNDAYDGGTKDCITCTGRPIPFGEDRPPWIPADMDW